GEYFWKDYEVRDDGFLNFIVSGIGEDRLKQAHTLLDIGAGSGKFSILLKRRFPHLQITASDLSPHNVSTIATNAKQAGVHVEATTASALDLPFETNSFDLVVCVYMLQHTQDPHQGFKESARVLKPGGTAFYAIGQDNGLGTLHHNTRWFFNRVPTALRTPSVWPALPLYWGLTHLLKRKKASYGELTKDMVDWLYNPLQKFVPEENIRRWFQDNHLAFEHQGYTGLFKSMLLCRGQKSKEIST
ncbi:MAG: class I SAM-dependent methyltransferase, partial [bacterium]|nr:class I SAM-dependent methyltransferase [bacterium]